ncbi:acyl-CoA N-acyltransferase [Phascolomyces articulosus]|uniref:Glucosamine 6-phosphate N-acetyltransferase n=1 Tax=Phascolomyces articulosus TaxID=60185 RepID=A0AAD5P8I0_9FUNG|nr:acyl-CoA N-acyltransferase [Phascolomyces articulosus]
MTVPQFVNPEIYLATTKEDLEKCIDVRFKVYTDEQKYPIELQTHSADDVICDHWLTTCQLADGSSKEKIPVGTIRLLQIDDQVGQLGRLAVLSDARGLQVGKKLVLTMLEGAKAKGIKKIFLEGQVDKRGFYEKMGFVLEEAHKEPYVLAGTPHYKMWMRSIP